ncbi:MAG: valine--tRNA ligase, partial [Patescibacteria group bacterium]
MDMSTSLPKAYEPKDTESEIYSSWERSGFFNPDNLPGKRTKTYSIAMPPANVTGELHLGHALGTTIQDILIRFKRMQGYKTLWLPGTDHAGISTQIMVERLIAQQGLDRHKLGRKAFLEHVWDWKKKYGTRITTQIRQMGASCDWSREHFTMDPKLTEAVQTAFIKLYKDGLIYRGTRIIHWCPRCASAISDLEVKYEERLEKLYYIRYQLTDTKESITVATTRPETMLGDTAVAVHPDDVRYKKFIGKEVILPIIERHIPVIADKSVEKEFGTGAVKVTPAHDHTDYDMGIRHKLPMISVIDEKAIITKDGGKYVGETVQDARHLIVAELTRIGNLEKTDEYSHNIATCDRCHTVIEPLLSKQWFVKVKPLAKKAITAVKSKKVTMVPKRMEKIYFHWMNNINDWCISRQLWWGHQIPVWYRGNEMRVSGKRPTGKGWVQDEDTLDTWFSSGLWTFSTLGWPKKTKDLKLFHSTDVLETAWDILFFWVARMIMMSLYLTGEIPFKTVYLHGLILDRDGKKMSKSKGTGIDPIPMTLKYGTDAIRLSLVLGVTAGQDTRLYEEKIAGYRNFINKLWNIFRFVESQGEKDSPTTPSIADRWILSQLQTLITKVTADIEHYRFSDAGTALYEFTWHELADWYIEVYKIHPNREVLNTVLQTLLRLLHPFAPFVTETLWKHTGKVRKTSDMLIVSSWPHTEKKHLDREAENQFGIVREFITVLRNTRST